MKKTKILVAAIAMATMITSSVFAALPSNALIIGDKAYDINYIAKNASKLNDIINNSTQFKDIYYNNGSEVKSLFTGSKLEDLGILPENIVYYDSNGNRSMYKYDKESKDFDKDKNSSTVEAEITVTDLGGIMKFVSIKIPNEAKVNIKPHNLEPKYFKAYNNNSSDMIKKIGKVGMTENEDDYILNLITTDPYIRLQILATDKSIIATTERKSLQQGKNTVTFSLDDYFRPPTANIDNYNGLGNLNNNGLAVQDGEWTYYSNSADGGGIYKTNGVINEKICNDNAKYINVSGEYIYYSNYSDGQRIYKIRKDGTGRRIVCVDQASFVVASGEYIYYSYHSGNGVGNIRKVSRNANKDIGTNITNDEAEFLTVSGDVIYFTNKYEGNAIYSVHTDGTYRSKLIGDSSKFITLVEGKIYYLTDAGQLKWINKSGGSFGSISVSNGNTGTNAIITSMNITDDGKWMYYADASDGNRIYRAPLVDYLRISGDKYSNDSANFINIIEDKVYFTRGNSMLIANEPKISPNRDTVGRVVYEYSSTPITKPKQGLKIVSYDKEAVPTKNAVGADLDNLEEYLPDKVTAVMSDNSVRELLVNWNLNPNKNNKGAIINYTGTIVGYGAKVTLKLSMASEGIPADSVKVINNAGMQDDKIFVNIDERGDRLPIQANIKPGDVIKVYRDPLKAELLGQETVMEPVTGKPMSCTIILRRNKTLTDDARKVYITRTSPNTLESEVIPVEINGDVVGRPTFDASNVTIKVTNYGKLPNGLTESDIVEIDPTTELKEGDVVNVYKLEDGMKTRIGSNIVELVPDSDPFAEKKFKCNIILPPGALEYDEENSANNKLYITRSTQFAESNDIVTSFERGIALPLGSFVVNGSSGNVMVFGLPQIPSEAYTPDKYQYYYKVGASIPVLGDSVDSSWTLIGDQANPIINANNGDKVYIVQTYNGKVLKCSKAIADVN
ncbi:DUF5050 domain-containing protein [Clostridium rectalis]|uniref:DUF5050 domain-containing protein n=1 Tax=Clostridium rectalis TaxID=2040295 RepID=UPI000F63D249|nr:DUF5050 domain-containing protein [Clostridium rectalis]